MIHKNYIWKSELFLFELTIFLTGVNPDKSHLLGQCWHYVGSIVDQMLKVLAQCHFAHPPKRFPYTVLSFV